MSCPLCLPTKNIVSKRHHWTIVLNDDQGYLGRCYFALNRHETDLTMLSQAEREELWELLAISKTALWQLWQPDHFNYVFLMNVQPHLHGHIIPRYASAREVEGCTFTDGELGKHYNLSNILIPDEKTLEAISLQIGLTVHSLLEAGQ